MEARANRLAHRFRRAGLVEGDTVAVLMENNEHLHTVMWAARRSGLYYAVINTHLTPPEAAYIIDNSGAKAVIGSQAMRKVCEGLAEHLPNGLPDLLMIADDDLDGWQRYPECVADEPDHPDRRRDRRRPAAVLVGNDRASQGNSPRAVAPAARRDAEHAVGSADGDRHRPATRSTSAPPRSITRRRACGR